MTPTAPRPSVGLHRSYWLREAITHDPGDPCPPLTTDLDTDVVILGGGYTGMWTAFFLSEYAPGCRVIIVESDICGGGASGRNGGFLTNWWDELGTMVAQEGAPRAIAACRALGFAITEIGGWCERHGIDAWFRKAGYLEAATSGAQERAVARNLAIAKQHGVEDDYMPLDVGQVQAHCASPRFRTGAFMRDGATIQPARLARGLRRVLLERGVRIFEGSPVMRFDDRQVPVTVETPSGSVRAGHAVVAMNAWSAAFRPFHRMLVAWASYIALTGPAPDRLARIGWTGGECITDMRTSVHYFRTTPDGRIAMGGGGGQAGSAGRIGPVFTHDESAVKRAVAALHMLFPSFAEVPIEAAWGGPIDVSSNRRPFFGTLPSQHVHFGFGYTGNGVAPSYLGGRILSALALGLEDDYTRLSLAEMNPRPFPMEPLRSIGARLVRDAIISTDDAAEEDRPASAVSRFVISLPARLGYHVSL